MKRKITFSTCGFLVAAVVSLSTANAQTQLGSLHHSNMPPGVVGQQQLMRNPTIPGYVQAVEVLAPDGVHISVVMGGNFVDPQPAPLLVGMQVGYVYQLKVTSIPFHEGAEIYPTVELVNRLYPPEGKKLRFPVPIELTEEEINMALRGQYVTRIVYLEDPELALPVRDDPDHQRVFDVGPKEDPLHVADRLGRPMAIVRMGSRIPDDDQLASGFDSPPLQLYPRQPKPKPTPPRTRPATVGPAIERHGQNIPRIDESATSATRRSPNTITDQP